jgi:hypothetical protein
MRKIAACRSVGVLTISLQGDDNMASAQKMLLEGVSDAVCFMLGALAGYGLGQAVGIDIFEQGYSGSGMVGILMVGLGGGAGLHIARIIRGRQKAKERLHEAETD